VLIGFDVVHWTSEQIGLVVGLWNAVVALALVFLVRARVTPTVEPTDTPPPPAVTGEGA
jgi:hypothetical protein